MRHRLGVCLLVLAAAGNAAESRLSHNGNVIDAATGKPIGSAHATAYGGNTTKDVGSCPKYDDFLDERSTKADGAFALRIPVDKSTYLVTYCHQQYVTFTRSANDNTVDRTPIDPMPVRLFPRNGGVNDMVAAISGIRGQAEDQAATVQRQHPDEFRKAVATFPASDGQLLATWSAKRFRNDNFKLQQRMEDWRNQNYDMNAVTPNTELRRITTSLRIMLDYFAAANHPAFLSAISKFPDLQEYLMRGGD